LRAWRDEYRRTWLADDRAVARLDRNVRGFLGGHRGVRGAGLATVAVTSVLALRDDVRALGDAQRWLMCTAGICFLAELVFSARFGGVWEAGRVTPPRAVPRDPQQILRMLRNAVCHPAHVVAAGAGVPAVEQLVAYLDGKGERGRVQALREDWSLLAGRDWTYLALAELDQVRPVYGPIVGFPR